MERQYNNELTTEVLAIIDQFLFAVKIVTGVGKMSEVNDSGVSLVSSLLDNGDVIISTPQDSFVLVGRTGSLMSLDFLSTKTGDA
ncbi:hypothetical protein [uncultured Cedecea sp.]|uniref:hypothetical protein n=1 Tax=uncultured Cedecea sp. TaxID=988762 RepID=UPI00261712B2|nr:hypothetical protein [uncultured Cedecea sp.]